MEGGTIDVFNKQITLGKSGLNKRLWDFPWDPEVEIHCAMQRTGIQSLVGDLGSHMLWSNYACTLQLLSLWA